MNPYFMKHIALATVILFLTSSTGINAQIKKIVLENAERVDTIYNKKLIGEIEKKDHIIGTNLESLMVNGVYKITN